MRMAVLDIAALNDGGLAGYDPENSRTASLPTAHQRMKRYLTAANAPGADLDQSPGPGCVGAARPARLLGAGQAFPAAGVDVIDLAPPAQTRLADPQGRATRATGSPCASKSKARRRNSGGRCRHLTNSSKAIIASAQVSGKAGQAPGDRHASHHGLTTRRGITPHTPHRI